ncbi:MAG: sugar transferase [Anaerolineae bacterium]|nr:sugar transferase [Anaerolineae bacterium]
MHKRNGTNYIIFLTLSDLALTFWALFLATQARHYLPWGIPLSLEEVRTPYIVYALVAIIWVGVFFTLSVYDGRRTLRAIDEMQLVTAAVAVAALVCAGVLYLTYRELPRRIFIYFFVADLLFLLSFRGFLRMAFRFAGSRQRGSEQVLIIGAGKVGRECARRVWEQAWTGLTLVGYMDDDPEKQGQTYEGAPVLGPLAQTRDIVRNHQVDEVIIALPLRAHRSLEELVLALQEQPVRVRVVPDFFALAFFRATIEDFGGIPLIGLRDPAIDGLRRVVKRVFDLLIAVPATLVLLPFMGLIIIAIRLDSSGSAIFRQQRVGENGKKFWIYKFRSMVMDAEQRQTEVIQETPDGVVLLKRPDDPRVTRVGRFIRRTSLDELPQLFNILKGDMSLVGPRPELPYLVERYEPWQRKRLAVPPGLTGWWQISGRSERPMHLHTEDDLYYIQHYSPLLDLQILWRTIGVVLKGRGAF